MTGQQTLWRDGGAALGGLLAAGTSIALIEMAGHGMLSGEVAFVPPLIGYALGAAIAAFIAGRFAAHPVRIAIGLALALAVLATINLFAMPHPVWFAPSAAIALALGCALGLSFRPTARSDAP
jgi:hypothetical protein